MVYLSPKNLNLESFFQANPPDEDKRVKLENLLYLVDLLSRLSTDRPDLISESGLISLSSRILNNKMDYYRDQLLYLTSRGIIESDDPYTASNIAQQQSKIKCLGYRFTNEYTTEVENLTVDNLKLTKLRRRDYNLKGCHKIEFRHLLKWFDNGLEIDLQQALLHNQSRYEEIKDDESKWERKM